MAKLELNAQNVTEQEKTTINHMEKSFKIFFGIAVVGLFIGIFIAINAPKSSLTIYEESDLQKAVRDWNSDLPRTIGTIGTMDSIVYRGKTIIYNLHPTKRGVYNFGKIRVFVSSIICFVVSFICIQILSSLLYVISPLTGASTYIGLSPVLIGKPYCVGGISALST